jgi:hypothetical protein
VSVEIVIADGATSALAEMLARLLEANLAAHPERARLVRAGTVRLRAVDAGEGVRIALTPGRVEIAAGAADGRGGVAIRASSRDLLDLSAAPLRLGFPDPLHPDGREVLRAIASGRIRITGMLRRPLALSRVARLLSVR